MLTRRRSGSLRSTWTPPQHRPISPRSTRQQHRTTKKRKSSSQHSSPRPHQRISATSKQLTTPNQYHPPRESPYLKLKRRSKSSLQRKPLDQTRSPTLSSRSATMK